MREDAVRRERSDLPGTVRQNKVPPQHWRGAERELPAGNVRRIALGFSARVSTVPADSRMKARLVSTAFSRHQGLEALTAATNCISIPIHLYFAEQ